MRSTLENKWKRFWLFAPLFGILLFCCLYVAAAQRYPGGSQIDKFRKGFSWSQNYWCNLLSENAINGAHNSARPIALTAMLLLCFSLAVFWASFPAYTPLPKRLKRSVQISGLLAMVIGVFLFTSGHDIIINIACLFGVIALLGTLAALWQLNWKALFYAGLFNFALAVLNNVLYYGSDRFYLPVVQKITFLYFLLWIAAINLKVIRREKALQLT